MNTARHITSTGNTGCQFRNSFSSELAESAAKARSGHSLIELLMVLSIGSIISISGFQLFAMHLENRNDRLAYQSGASQFDSLVGQLQQSFDKRYQNPFSSGPWLRTVVEAGADWPVIKALYLTKVENGAVLDWQWNASEWHRIQVWTDKPVCHAGESPAFFIVKFPDSSIRRFRQGISIEGL